MKRRPVMVAVALLLIGGLILGMACSSSPSGSSGSATPEPTPNKRTYSAPPPMTIDVNKNYTATIVTDKGDIVMQLYPKEAPKTVNSFVFLAKQGFYNGSTFHRVIPRFVAQGGDPTGTGSGGPGYTIPDEFSPNLSFDSAGVVGMANAGPNTNGSQFFITYAAQPSLSAYNADGTKRNCGQPGIYCYTVFAKVIQGMDVVNNLTPRDPQQNPNFVGDKIITIKISEQ